MSSALCRSTREIFQPGLHPDIDLVPAYSAAATGAYVANIPEVDGVFARRLTYTDQIH